MSWVHLMIVLPLLFAVFIPLLYKAFPRIHTGWFVLVVPVVIFGYLATYLPMLANGETAMYEIPWIPYLDINFAVFVDGLGLIFALIISGIGALVVIYSIYYLSKAREALHNFYVYLMMFMGAMLGVVLSDNMIVLYLFWELTSISSFLLIAYWYQRKQSRFGAQKAMLITVLGGFAMLASIIMIHNITGTFSIREVIAQSDLLVQHDLFLPAMLLLLLGAFTKSAQFPFHIWLPDAMEAPTPISAYLHSATMVKAGIYLVARFTPAFGGTPEWFWIVTFVGLFTIWGSLNAVKQRDLKALLAFSTISQLGLIMSLLGMGSAALYFNPGDQGVQLHAYAVLAAVFHLINHSTFKGSLFMVVGIVDHETGTRDMRKLGGLTIMPVSFTLAVIGSLSMAGLPPFNGFISKEMFFTGTLNAANLDIFNMATYGAIIPIVAWIASVFTFIYSIILVYKTFLGKYQPERLEKKAHEAPLGMLIPPSILGFLVLAIFFFPNVIGDYALKPMVASIIPSAAGVFDDYTISWWHGFVPELFMTMAVVALGLILFATLNRWIGLYNHMPQWMHLNNWFKHGLSGMERGSHKVIDWHMTGYIRDYLMYIFITIILIVGGSYFMLTDFTLYTDNLASINLFEIVLALVLLGSTVLVMATRSRLTAVVSVGVLGYVVALFFIILRAPDLALTQLAIETVSVALYLLCFYHLPKLKSRSEEEGEKFKVSNFIVALGVGSLVTLLALSVNGYNLFEPISTYYGDSYDLAGAANMVNAILADFRGFDTFLEIVVVAIAGLGVYALVRLRLEKRRGTDESQ
ncbi:LOW QUALITY PROTEIN: Na(+) H(+) antiporter subunit A [Geomicrobium sp. JCM 19055]|nr:LOW QUALITY PROTEIN: Na(+) H(+) antiporter subunit A [Geomicrobium sp. JCM 19055]